MKLEANDIEMILFFTIITFCQSSYVNMKLRKHSDKLIMIFI